MALELGEDRLVALAHDVGQHVQSTPVRHAEHGAVELGVRRLREDLVENRDRRLRSFDPEPLRADVLRREELLERLRRIEALEDPALALLGDLGLHPFELLLDPLLLVGVLDVHVLHADRAAVRVTQHAEQFTQRQLVDAADTVGEELAVEVPDGEPVGRRVEFPGRHRLLPPQRIEVGDEVPTHAVHTDQLGDRHLLREHRVFTVDRVRVGPPLDRLVRHAERVEDVLVEVVFTEQQFVDVLEEHARLGALDDAMVVGAGDRDDLADADRAEVGAVRALEGGGEVDAADADDHGLARHEARHRLDRADRAGVGEAHVRALEVLHGELVRLHLADDLLVRSEEAGEVERVGVTDDRNHQRPAAVGLLDVDGEAHVHVLVDDDPRLAVGALDVGVPHRRHLVGDGAHDGVADDVGEADLGLATARPEAVDDLAVHLEQLGGHVAEAGRRRHGQAALHVRRDRGAGATNGLAGLVGRIGAGRRNGVRPVRAPFVAGAAAFGTIGSESGERWASTTAWTWVDTAAAAATLGVWDW